jgi:2-polyprenyl-6-methoxyphenol hydroxylase-like FAD-dependent oxidoreductase
VVGAGPVGLTAAAMLAAYGIRTVVLDRADGPAGHSRAAVVHARTLETLKPIGIVDEAVRRGVVVRSASLILEGFRARLAMYEVVSKPPRPQVSSSPWFVEETVASLPAHIRWAS